MENTQDPEAAETVQTSETPAVAPAATCYASLRGRLLRKWDWWIYRRAYHSLRRMTLDNPGMSYLMELQLRGWNNQLEISPELKRATEAFHSAMEDHRHNSGISSISPPAIPAAGAPDSSAGS